MLEQKSGYAILPHLKDKHLAAAAQTDNGPVLKSNHSLEGAEWQVVPSAHEGQFHLNQCSTWGDFTSLGICRVASTGATSVRRWWIGAIPGSESSSRAAGLGAVAPRAVVGPTSVDFRG